jgi:hypothetical protein
MFLITAEKDRYKVVKAIQAGIKEYLVKLRRISKIKELVFWGAV